MTLWWWGEVRVVCVDRAGVDVMCCMLITARPASPSVMICISIPYCLPLSVVSEPTWKWK